MYKSEKIKNTIKDYYKSELVNSRVDAYFDNFDEKLVEKMLFSLKNYSEKNSFIMISSQKDGVKYSIEYDNDNSVLLMRRDEQSFDKISTETQELSFSTFGFSQNPDEKGIIGKNFFPELTISRKNNDYINFDLLNQSKTKSIAGLESQKNEYFEHYAFNNRGMIVSQKFVNSGLVDDFSVKRLKNKQFYFVREKNYLFSPYLKGYPYEKRFHKRFIIKHKNLVQTSLAEDFEIHALRDTGYETLTYRVNGTPFFKKSYCDFVANRETYYIKKSSKNPYEINQALGSEKMFSITDMQLDTILENPEIGKKVFQRKKRHEKQKSAIWEV